MVRADTYAVAGVVVQGGVRQRRIKVGLYVSATDRDYQGAWSSDITSNTGVYSFFARNLIGVQELFIVVEEPGYEGSVQVTLSAATREAGISKLIAGDLEIYPPLAVYDTH